MAIEENDISAALLFASAFRRHPSEFVDRLAEVIDTLAAGILEINCSQFVSIALMLAHLPVPELRQDKIRHAAQSRLPPVWGVIFEAIAAYDWPAREENPGQIAIDLPDLPPLVPSKDPEDIRWRVEAFNKVLTLDRSPEPDVELSGLEWSIEPGYALLKSAECLALVDPDVVAKARISPLVRDSHTRVHVDMMAAEHAGVPNGAAVAQPQWGLEAITRQDMAALAEVISRLAEPEIENRDHGDWSLDIILQVLRAADVHHNPPGVIADLVSQGQDTLIKLLYDVGAFLGFSPRELSASAASCTEILPRNPGEETAIDYQWGVVLYDGKAERTDSGLPREVDTSEDDGGQRQRPLDRIVSVALSDDPIAPYVAVFVLPQLASRSPAMVAATLRARLVLLQSREFVQVPASLAILTCDLDLRAVAELRKSPSPSIRWGALHSVAHRVICEGAEELRELLTSLAMDQDLSVRFAIADHAERHDHVAVDNIEELTLAKLSAPAAYWSCIACAATDQPIDDPICQNCGEETQPALVAEAEE